jgi:antitoxin VapB
MALNIRNSEAERLAKALAKLTGETQTEAVTQALRERLARLLRERTSSASPMSSMRSHCIALGYPCSI